MRLIFDLFFNPGFTFVLWYIAIVFYKKSGVATKNILFLPFRLALPFSHFEVRRSLKWQGQILIGVGYAVLIIWIINL